MAPKITAAWPDPQSSTDGVRCWHVAYEFCEVSAHITVHAKDEPEARTKAAEQLRIRGLKVA